MIELIFIIINIMQADLSFINSGNKVLGIKHQGIELFFE